MRKIARLRSDGDSRQAWTLVLAAGALLALAPTVGLISPRSRSAAEPPSEPRVGPEHEATSGVRKKSAPRTAAFIGERQSPLRVANGKPAPIRVRAAPLKPGGHKSR